MLSFFIHVANRHKLHVNYFMCFVLGCSVSLSVRLSVCHTRESRLNETSALNRSVDGENYTNNPPYLGNDARQQVNSLIGSRTRAFHWYRNWWPWMTLNGVMAVILCYCAKSGHICQLCYGWLRLWEKIAQECSLRQYMIYAGILRGYWEKCVKVGYTLHSTAEIRIVQDCATMLALAELLSVSVYWLQF